MQLLTPVSRDVNKISLCAGAWVKKFLWKGRGEASCVPKDAETIGIDRLEFGVEHQKPLNESSAVVDVA